MRKMNNLKVVAPLYFCCLLVVTNAQDQEGHEPDVVAGIDPATEVRMGTLLRDHEIKDFHLSTDQVYIRR